MDWKKENYRIRYIDSITEEEAKEIAYIALGKPKYYEFTNVLVDCKDNNIPHVVINCKTLEPALIGEWMVNQVGIFHSLDVYIGKYHKPYCQRELHKRLEQMGF